MRIIPGNRMIHRWGRLTRFLCAAASGALLGLAWDFSWALPFLFVVPAFVLILLESSKASFSSKLFLIIYPFILAWSISVNWWVWIASPGGCISMVVSNGTLLCSPWAAYVLLRRKFSIWVSVLFWALFSLSIEYIHYNWEPNFPWLNFGNAFSVFTDGIQWISYTGVAGVSIWIIIVNAMGYAAFLSKKSSHKKYLALAALVAVVFPIAGSVWWMAQNKDYLSPGKKTQSVFIVQPNIENYTEKFTLSPEEQVDKLLNLSHQSADTQTNPIWIWPETSIPQLVRWQDSSSYNALALESILADLQGKKETELIAGAVAYSKDSTGKTFYYNIAIHIKDNKMDYIHTKCKLVPGVESIPMHKYFPFLDQLSINMGGVAGSLATDDAVRLAVTKSGTKMAVIICYESVFGDFVSNFVKSGADMICLITNDGWWGESPGYKQHLAFGKMRCIENRRYMIRNANTGVSGIIDPYGRIHQPLAYNRQGVIKASVPIETSLTFYTRHGDYLYLIASLCWGTLIIYIIAKRFIDTANKRSKGKSPSR